MTSFRTLAPDYAEDAAKLAQSSLIRQCAATPALPAAERVPVSAERLAGMFAAGPGFAAFERGRLVGFLSFLPPFRQHFGKVRGVYSPLGANAAAEGPGRGRLLSRLFEHASRELVEEAVLSFALTNYANDREGNRSWILNGFGIRCADAVRLLDGTERFDPSDGLVYEEIPPCEAGRLYELKCGLIRHLRNSPVWFPVPGIFREAFEAECREGGDRFFVVRDGARPVGYLEVTEEGENFISESGEMRNLCGAYVEPEYRGRGVARNLLFFLCETLKREGETRLGVDCETLNPAALRFWEKYFTIYTYGFVRRLDERIL